MPISIPAFAAARFVQKKTLDQRIKVLKNSYKAQMVSLPVMTILANNKTILKTILEKATFFT